MFISVAHGNMMKYVSLICLTLQNATLVLVMRYSRTRDMPLYLTTTTVVMAEVVKFVSCNIIIFIEVSETSHSKSLDVLLSLEIVMS